MNGGGIIHDVKGIGGLAVRARVARAVIGLIVVMGISGMSWSAARRSEAGLESPVTVGPSPWATPKPKISTPTPAGGVRSTFEARRHRWSL